MSLIGKTFRLWHTTFELDGYKDQFGIIHNAYLIWEEVDVTVVQEKQVPVVWGRGTGTGRKAVDEEGREYYNNWHSFDDSSMSPSSYWVRGTDKKSFERSECSKHPKRTPYVYQDTLEEGRCLDELRQIS